MSDAKLPVDGRKLKRAILFSVVTNKTDTIVTEDLLDHGVDIGLYVDLKAKLAPRFNKTAPNSTQEFMRIVEEEISKIVQSGKPLCDRKYLVKIAFCTVMCKLDIKSAISQSEVLGISQTLIFRFIDKISSRFSKIVESPRDLWKVYRDIQNYVDIYYDSVIVT